MQKRLLFMLLAVSVCLLLAACDPYGPKTYGLNAKWETDGNCISVIEAFSADSYCTPEDSEYKPDDGYVFLIAKLSAELAADWNICAPETKLEKYSGNSGGSYALYCDPIVETSDTGEQIWALLFALNADDYTGDPEDYALELCILKPTLIMRRQTFLLKTEP